MTIFCCCNQATELCSDTCARWRGTSGPEHVVLVPQWPKTRRSGSVITVDEIRLKWDREGEETHSPE